MAKLRIKLDDDGCPAARHVGEAFEPIACRGCVLTPPVTWGKGRAYFEDCSFSKVRLSKCVLGHPVFVRCTLRDVRADFLMVESVVLRECVLEGRIQNVNFMSSSTLDPPYREQLETENEAILQGAKFWLDVRATESLDVWFHGQEWASRVMFRRGQCLILRGSDLAARAARAYTTIQDPNARLALFAVKEQHAAVQAWLHRLSPGELPILPSVRAVCSRFGIETVEEPIIG